MIILEISSGGFCDWLMLDMSVSGVTNCDKLGGSSSALNSVVTSCDVFDLIVSFTSGVIMFFEIRLFISSVDCNVFWYVGMAIIKATERKRSVV